MPVVGFLARRWRLCSSIVTAFRQGLKEAGFVEGQNVAVEYRWAEGQIDRLPALGGRSGPPSGGRDRRDWRRAALAAKAATTTVPIVFAIGGDPVKLGPRRQPQPAGRQRHRRRVSYRRLRQSSWNCCASCARATRDRRARAIRQCPDADVAVQDVAGAPHGLGLQFVVMTRRQRP